MLSDKIWITRKTRIFTEQRLQNNANFSQALIVTYSLALVSLSIWNLVNNNQKLNVISVVASIVILVLSVYLTTQKYTERSLAMRNCYVKLDELYSKAARAESGKDEITLEKLESEYTSLLINIENHSEYDFLCLRYSLKDNNNTTLPTFTRKDCLMYIWQKTWRVVVTIIAFAISIPFIVFIWF